MEKLENQKKAQQAIGSKLAQIRNKSVVFNNIAIPTVQSKSHSKAYVSFCLKMMMILLWKMRWYQRKRKDQQHGQRKWRWECIFA